MITATVLLTLVGWGVACSRDAVPRNIVRRLSDADRAIITHYTSGGEARVPLTPEEIKKLVQAISTAHKGDPGRCCAASLQVGFFKGTNTLGHLLASHEHEDGFGFGIDGKVYLDKTGTLKAITARFGEHGSHP